MFRPAQPSEGTGGRAVVNVPDVLALLPDQRVCVHRNRVRATSELLRANGLQGLQPHGCPGTDGNPIG